MFDGGLPACLRQHSLLACLDSLTYRLHSSVIQVPVVLRYLGRLAEKIFQSAQGMCCSDGKGRESWQGTATRKEKARQAATWSLRRHFVKRSQQMASSFSTTIKFESEVKLEGGEDWLDLLE